MIALRCREGPAGLTAREVDVHIGHIYTKTGATSRVTASLFAMQHGLLPDERPVGP